MSFWSAAGSVLGSYVLDLFIGDDDKAAQGGGASSAQQAQASAHTKAYQQASLAGERARTGIQTGKDVSPFKAQNDMANFVKANVNPDEVRQQLVAQLVRQGADSQTVENVLAQWDTQDRALAEPRKALPQEGFAQTKYSATV